MFCLFIPCFRTPGARPRSAISDCISAQAWSIYIPDQLTDVPKSNASHVTTRSLMEPGVAVYTSLGARCIRTHAGHLIWSQDFLL